MSHKRTIIIFSLAMLAIAILATPIFGQENCDKLAGPSFPEDYTPLPPIPPTPYYGCDGGEWMPGGWDLIHPDAWETWNTGACYSPDGTVPAYAVLFTAGITHVGCYDWPGDSCLIQDGFGEAVGVQIGNYQDGSPAYYCPVGIQYWYWSCPP